MGIAGGRLERVETLVSNAGGTFPRE